MCLIAKNELKNDRIFKFFEINEIHRVVDSPFNEDPKNIIFFQRDPISGEGRRENLGKMGNNRDIYCYGNRGWSVSKEYQPPPPGTKIIVMPQFPYMPDQILGKK